LAFSHQGILEMVADQEQAFRSLILLVAVCEQALLEFETAQRNAPDLVAKIEATRAAAVETIATFRKPPAIFGEIESH
jgi:hypothetical protein